MDWTDVNAVLRRWRRDRKTTGFTVTAKGFSCDTCLTLSRTEINAKAHQKVFH